MCVCVHSCHDTGVEIEGQFCGISSLCPPLHGFQGSNSGILTHLAMHICFRVESLTKAGALAFSKATWWLSSRDPPDFLYPQHWFEIHISLLGLTCMWVMEIKFKSSFLCVRYCADSHFFISWIIPVLFLFILVCLYMWCMCMYMYMGTY